MIRTAIVAVWPGCNVCVSVDNERSVLDGFIFWDKDWVMEVIIGFSFIPYTVNNSIPVKSMRIIKRVAVVFDIV